MGDWGGLRQGNPQGWVGGQASPLGISWSREWSTGETQEGLGSIPGMQRPWEEGGHPTGSARETESHN